MMNWIYGSALEMKRDVLAFYSACERESGFLRTHMWRMPLCIVTDPALIEEVLIRRHRCFIKSAGLRATQLAFGQGLLTSDGDQWLSQRKTIQPAFHLRRLERYGVLIKKATEAMLGGWHDGEVRNVHRDMTDLCFDVLARSLFGDEMIEARELVAATAEALHAFHHLHAQWIGAAGGLAYAAVRAISTRLGRPDFVIEPTLLPTSYARRFRDAVGAMDAFVYALMAERRRAPVADDLMSLLLSAKDDDGRPLPDRQIRDEVVTMFLAGHETAASSLSWALQLLAQHPEVAGAVAAQGSGGAGAVSIEQVMFEAMRLYPPAYRISRTAVQACRVGSHEIRAGDELIIPQWAVHRSPRWFDAPDEFRPERWTAEFSQALPKFAFFPFGGGPRTCIGNTFAMREANAVLGGICRQFELSVFDTPARPYFGVTLLPENNTLRLQVSRRAQPRVEAAPPARTGRCPFHHGTAMPAAASTAVS